MSSIYLINSRCTKSSKDGNMTCTTFFFLNKLVFTSKFTCTVFPISLSRFFRLHSIENNSCRPGVAPSGYVVKRI